MFSKIQFKKKMIVRNTYSLGLIYLIVVILNQLHQCSRRILTQNGAAGEPIIIYIF